MEQEDIRNTALLVLRQAAPELKEKYGVQKIAVYGSFAKGNPGDVSDIDILVQLSQPLGLEFVRLATDLEAILHRRVDLATFDNLKRTALQPRRAHIAADIERSLVYV